MLGEKKLRIQMANKHIKTCSTSPVTREKQIKTMTRYHYMSIRTAKIKKTVIIPNAGEDEEK